MARPFVNFLIVGVQKAGTTALARFLGAHPEICLPQEKEVHLFDAADYASTWPVERIDERYRAALSGWRGEPLVGEATPIYLYWPYIAAELRRYNPELRLIVLLRDPVERALSHYSMERGRNQEHLPPLAAFLAEPARLRRDRGDRSERSSWRLHSYQDRGRYAAQLSNLWAAFPREQVLVLRSESLWHAHAATLGRVYRFLGAAVPEKPPERERIFGGEPAGHGAALARAWLRTRLAVECRRLERNYPVEREQPAPGVSVRKPN